MNQISDIEFETNHKYIMDCVKSGQTFMVSYPGYELLVEPKPEDLQFLNNHNDAC